MNQYQNKSLDQLLEMISQVSNRLIELGSVVDIKHRCELLSIMAEVMKDESLWLSCCLNLILLLLRSFLIDYELYYYFLFCGKYVGYFCLVRSYVLTIHGVFENLFCNFFRTWDCILFICHINFPTLLFIWYDIHYIIIQFDF